MTFKNPSFFHGIWIPSALPVFIFGLIYYLISPFISLTFFSDYKLLAASLLYFDLDYFNLYYFTDVFLILLCFILGYRVSKKIKVKNISYLDKYNRYTITPLLIFTLLFLYYLLILIKVISSGLMFSGYSTYDKSILGPASTLTFTTVFFYNFFSMPSVKRLYIILFILNSITLLGLGSRMYFTIGLISILLGYVSLNKHLLTSLRLYFISAISLIFIVGIGVWRNSGKINTETLVEIFLAEPLFTSITGALYIENSGGRPIFSAPTDIIASVVNFIPSMIYPNKIDVINSLTYDANKEAPFGASSLIVNLYSNFGFFYPIYLILMGFFFGILKKKANSSFFYRAVYFSTLPTLIFHFYREGFITLIKIIFFNGLIFPAVVLGIVGTFVSHRK